MPHPPHIPGHFVMDHQRSLLLPPEWKAEPPEEMAPQMFIERSLAENRFWLRLMKEHALFISEGFRRQDAHLIQEALKFYQYYEQQEKRAHNTPPTEKAVRRLNEDSLQLTYGFRNFKRNILILILQCKIFSNGGFNIPMQLDHIARERAFIDDFDVLLSQAKDVQSMLLGKEPTYPLIGKMLKDSENITIELRNFKKMGLEYLKSCQIQNISSTMLLDHVVREAEHFLFLIHVLEERLKMKQRESAGT